MIYRVVTYDMKTERMLDSLAIPPILIQQAKQIAGFRPEDDGLGEYLLNEEQIRSLGTLLGFYPEPARFYYYVEPYEPPEDTGLQERKAA